MIDHISDVLVGKSNDAARSAVLVHGAAAADEPTGAARHLVARHRPGLTCEWKEN